MISKIITIIIVVAALVAAVISYQLTVKHITGSSGVAWIEAICSNEPGSGNMDCAKVLNSPYSYFPPKHEDKPGGTHVPISFLGLIYYSALSVWLIGVGRPSFSRRQVHLLPLLLAGIGLASSAWLIYIMSRVVSAWCPLCLVTHGLNLLIAVGLIALWPRSRRGELAVIGDGQISEGAIIAAPHPTSRLLVTTLLAIFFVSYGHFFFFEWRDLLREGRHLKAELDYLRSNVGGFIAQWQLAPKCDLTSRPDDPIREFSEAAQSGPLLDIVVFSDFECPGCAKFAQFFDKRVPPIFENRVRLTFRHFPLDQSCNPRSSATKHPHACSAAFLAEGARSLGGSAAFWKAHDFLFENQSAIVEGRMTAERLAGALRLDAAKLQAAADPATLTPRIHQDIDRAKSCNIGGTPSVFVEGKRIDPAAVANLTFWDKLADWFWLEKARKDRPQSTRIPPVAAPVPQG